MGVCSSSCQDPNQTPNYEAKLVFRTGVYRVAGPICVQTRPDPESRIVCKLQDNAEIELLATTGCYIQVDGPVRGYIPFINPRTKECSLDMDTYEDREFVFLPRNAESNTGKYSEKDILVNDACVDDEVSDNDNTASSSVLFEDDSDIDVYCAEKTENKPSRTKTITYEKDPFSRTSSAAGDFKTYPKSAPSQKNSGLQESQDPIELGEQIKDDLALEKLKKMKRVTRVKKDGFAYWEKPIERKYSGGASTKKLRKVKSIKKKGLKYWEKPVERKVSETLLALQTFGRVKE